MQKALWGLGCLALAGITAILVSVEIAQAQRNYLTVKDANGKEVIVYQESHALVIWAGDYKNWGKLNNVQNEAKDVVRELQKQGFQVRVIANPNGNQLSTGIKNFIDDYGYLLNNRLVIFFAGHGHTRQQTKGYLVPVDAPDPIVDERGFLKAALSMEQINSWASQMEAKHVLFVFDSCFSGTIFKQRSNGDDARDAYIRDVMNKPVRQFLTAGDANEKVPAKSVFTPLFLRALEGEADYTKDGYVTGRELGLYLTQNLTNYTKGNQHPQFGTILDPNLDRGDIVFRSYMAVASSPPSTVKPTPTEKSANRSQPVTNPVATPSPEPRPEPTVAVVTPPKPAPSNPPSQQQEEEGTKLLERSIELVRLKKYDEAFSLAQSATELAPKRYQTWFVLGTLYLQQDKIDKGIDTLQTALKLAPEEAGILFTLGNGYFQKGDYQAAITQLEAGLKLKPNVVTALFDLGNSYLKSNRYNDALDSYQKAISQDKQFLPALHNIGLIKYEQGDTKAALKAWNEAVSIDKTQPEPQLAIAVALFKQGDKEQGIKLGQAALALDNRYGKITFLEENLWGRTLLQDTQLFFALPQIQSIINAPP